MKRFASGFVAVALGMLLAGCLGSENPVFPLSSAVPALGEGGRYVTFEHAGDGKFTRDSTIEVRKRADGGYDFIDDKGDSTQVSLHPIAGGRHVGQATTKNKRIRFGYVIFSIEGNEVLIYATDCDKQDRAKLEALGVVIEGKYECLIDKVADPVSLFNGLTLGPPTSKMVRE
jgi:hypothetical protein